MEILLLIYRQSLTNLHRLEVEEQERMQTN